MAGFVELTVEQGATFSTEITLKDVYSQPINLSQYTVNSQMRKSYYSTTAITFTSTVVDAGQGTLKISLPASQTSNVTPGRYVYDVTITTGSVVTRVIEGIVTVLPSVTR